MMRVPNRNAPLVSIPGGGSAGFNAGKAGLESGTPRMSMRVPAAAFRGNSALEPLADAMAAATKATEAIMKGIQAKRAEIDANNAFAQLSGNLDAFLHGEGGIYARHGVRANGVVEDTRHFFEKDMARLSKGMNEAAGKLFDSRAMQLRFSTQNSVAQHAGRELQQALLDSRLAAIKADIGSIHSNPSDVRGGVEAMGRIRENAALIAGQKGMDAEDTNAFVGKAVSAAQRGQIESFAQLGKFEMAFAIWKNTRDDLTADDRMQAYAGIRKAAWDFFKQNTVERPQAFLDVAREDGWDKQSGDGNDEAGFARKMNPETIGDMLSAAEKRALMSAAGSTIRKMEEENSKAQKQRRDDAERNLYALAAEGTLTRENIEAARDDLYPADYWKFLKISQGEESLPKSSDVESVLLLQKKIVNEDSDFQETADQLLREGKITISDYTSRSNEAQQWRKPIMKEADSILRARTEHSEYNPNPNADNSYIMAHQDFMNWLDSPEGKQSKDDDKIRMAERIGDLYRLNQAETVLSVPAPLNLVGTRKQPDIPATIQRIEAARVAGRLTDEQYRQEMIRIKRLADILAAGAKTEREGVAKRGAGRSVR
jgi:hypothetical protein